MLFKNSCCLHFLLLYCPVQYNVIIRIGFGFETILNNQSVLKVFLKERFEIFFAGGWAPGLILKDNFVLYLRASLIITILMFHICNIVVTQSENFFEKSKFQNLSSTLLTQNMCVLAKRKLNSLKLFFTLWFFKSKLLEIIATHTYSILSEIQNF